MNRRDLLRTALLTALCGNAAVAESIDRAFSQAPDPLKDLERADWTPLFLDDHQNQTLIALSDLIIPATGTPGAKDALVNRFLDLLMSIEIPETQRAFVSALAYFDGACMERYKSAFLYLSHDRQMDFLSLIAYPHSHQTWDEPVEAFPGHTHFQKLKSWIVGAYYSSPVGLKELGWDGTFPHGVFSGCEHSGAAHHDAPHQEA